MKKFVLMGVSLVAALAAGYLYWPSASAYPTITVWQSPTCGCCEGWAEYMKDNGFEVKSHMVSDVEAVKSRLGVPEDLWSCHTAVMGDYVLEGHVPAQAVQSLWKDKPSDIRGLSSPGMASGNAGMDGPRVDNVIMTFGQNPPKVYGVY